MEPRFNPPPGWPSPPTPDWRPEPDWQPSDQWPTAPGNWPFWVDHAGQPVAGPAGLYGAKGQASTGKRVAGCGCAGLLVIFLLGSCIAALGSAGEEPEDTAVTSTVTLSLTATVTPTETVSPTTTVPTPTQTGPEETVTVTPTVTAEPPAPEPEPARPTSNQPLVPAPAPEPEPPSGGSGPFENCTAAREAGAAPVLRGDPGYGNHLDRDGDGVGCEN